MLTFLRSTAKSSQGLGSSRYVTGECQSMPESLWCDSMSWGVLQLSLGAVYCHPQRVPKWTLEHSLPLL